MQNPERLDAREAIWRAFNRFCRYSGSSNDLSIADDFLESVSREAETSQDDVITFAKKMMLRIIKERPIPDLSTRLGTLESHKLLNEKFAFVLGLALIGIDAFQLEKDDKAAKYLTKEILSPNCREGRLEFWLRIFHMRLRLVSSAQTSKGAER